VPCAERIAGWRAAANLWQARASLVAFVPVAHDAACYPLISASCPVLIRRPERFAKTALGWILREIAGHDEALVTQVIEQNLVYFSLESLKNATKSFDRQRRQHYRQRLKQVQVQ
jgi:3-methyladenine DNA glycosylase AlkD